MLTGFLQRLKKEPFTKKAIQPVIVPRSEHTISRKAISPHALKVLYRLHEGGYSAYLVGGCVRDLLLGYRPKDFDIATNARPEEVRRLFRNCRLIGKRFRLAHILFGQEIIEVATFRTHHTNAQHETHAKMHEGMIIRDNVYGDIEDDAWRRDFSINALYYNIADFSVVDYTGGMSDIKNKILRMIGEPEQRFQEDPVRLLRAVRFLGKLDIQVSPETEHCLMHLSYLLENVSSARLFQEVLKFFHEGAAAATFKLLEKYHLVEQLFPPTAACLKQSATKQLIEAVLINTDERIQAGKNISPAFLFTALLWRPILKQSEKEEAEGTPAYVALEKALQHVLKQQTHRLAIPRALLTSIRDICLLQHHFTRRQGARPYRSLEHTRFRAAYDLLLLRATTGEPVQEIADWWTQFHTANAEQREQLIKQTHSPRSQKRRSYRNNKNRRKKKNTSPPA